MNQNNSSESYVDENSAQGLLKKWGPVLEATSKDTPAIESDRTRGKPREVVHQ